MIQAVSLLGISKAQWHPRPALIGNKLWKALFKSLDCWNFGVVGRTKQVHEVTN